MSQLKVNKYTNDELAHHLQDMQPVLAEISMTYEVLLDVITKQRQALSSPTIEVFQKELTLATRNAISSARAITKAVQNLALLSERASTKTPRLTKG